MNHMYQEKLKEKNMNYIMTDTRLMLFKDPKSGESLFTQVGLDLYRQQDLLKAIETSVESGDKMLNEVYGQVLNPPMVDPSAMSFF